MKSLKHRNNSLKIDEGKNTYTSQYAHLQLDVS